MLQLRYGIYGLVSHSMEFTKYLFLVEIEYLPLSYCGFLISCYEAHTWGFGNVPKTSLIHFQKVMWAAAVIHLFIGKVRSGLRRRRA